MANVDGYEVVLTPMYQTIEHLRGDNLSTLPENATVGVVDVTYYLMQADDSVTGAIYTWQASPNPDWNGTGYPGPNLPLEITVIGMRSV